MAVSVLMHSHARLSILPVKNSNLREKKTLKAASKQLFSVYLSLSVWYARFTGTVKSIQSRWFMRNFRQLKNQFFEKKWKTSFDEFSIMVNLTASNRLLCICWTVPSTSQQARHERRCLFTSSQSRSQSRCFNSINKSVWGVALVCSFNQLCTHASRAPWCTRLCHRLSSALNLKS